MLNKLKSVLFYVLGYLITIRYNLVSSVEYDEKYDMFIVRAVKKYLFFSLGNFKEYYIYYKNDDTTVIAVRKETFANELPQPGNLRLVPVSVADAEYLSKGYVNVIPMFMSPAIVIAMICKILAVTACKLKDVCFKDLQLESDDDFTVYVEALGLITNNMAEAITMSVLSTDNRPGVLATLYAYIAAINPNSNNSKYIRAEFFPNDEMLVANVYINGIPQAYTLSPSKPLWKSGSDVVNKTHNVIVNMYLLPFMIRYYICSENVKHLDNHFASMTKLATNWSSKDKKIHHYQESEPTYKSQ